MGKKTLSSSIKLMEREEELQEQCSGREASPFFKMVNKIKFKKMKESSKTQIILIDSESSRLKA